MFETRPEERLLTAISQALEESGLFARVERDARKEGVIYDLLATAKPGIEPAALAFEIKSRSVADKDVVLQAAGRANLLKASLPQGRLVLVIGGQLTEQARAAASQVDLAVLSADDLLAADGVPLLKQAVHSIRTVMAFSPPDPRAEELQRALQATPPGSPGWAQYQKLICDIFEYLFCDVLDRPRYENPDAARRNRRDMIFGNPCEYGFWGSVRRDYLAHYVVVDAKNYRFRIEKTAILQLAHYLKPYGCGLFGIIASRHRITPSGLHAMREQWISAQKMIVALSDEDIIDMLRMKSIRNRPEEILRAKIADFRVSL
jgi:hypothetical protein